MFEKAKLLESLIRADDFGVRLEIVGGLPVWEASPVLRHQKQDVVVFNPHTLVVLHITQKGAERHISPVALLLECGCQCVV